MAHFRGWVGKVGAARVKHEDYKGAPQAKVAYFISREKQEKMDIAPFAGATTQTFAPVMDIDPSDLPFS